MKCILSAVLLVALAALVSCKSSTSRQAVADSTEKVTFFPVTSFLKSELKVLDTIPATVLLLTTADGKTDSAWINREQVKPMLSAFTEDLIDKENLSGLFKESRFNDQSTDAITFTYDPVQEIPQQIHLRHWDVYVDPEKGRVKRIYLVRQVTRNDSSFTQQLTWVTGKSAKIVTLLNQADGKTVIQSDQKWIWDFSE